MLTPERGGRAGPPREPSAPGCPAPKSRRGHWAQWSVIFFPAAARLTFRGGRRNLESGFPERERGGRGIPGQLTAQAQAVTNRRGRGEHASGQAEAARASTGTQGGRRMPEAQAQAARVDTARPGSEVACALSPFAPLAPRRLSRHRAGIAGQSRVCWSSPTKQTPDSISGSSGVSDRSCGGGKRVGWVLELCCGFASTFCGSGGSCPCQTKTCAKRVPQVSEGMTWKNSGKRLGIPLLTRRR